MHHLFDSVDDVRIGSAAAEVTTHQFADVFVALHVTFFDEPNGRAELARRTVAALEGIMLDEGLLEWMKF